METIDAIKMRRSSYKFKRKDIDKKIVEDILNCGRLAPSAKNRQPWYFIILKGEQKDHVADLMIKYTKNADEKVERKKIHAPSSVLASAEVIKNVPILICIFKKKDPVWTVGDSLSLGACIENMCLRATDLGLGSLWMRDTLYVATETAKFIGHNDMEFNSALAIGYIEKNVRRPLKKELSDITEWV